MTTLMFSTSWIVEEIEMQTKENNKKIIYGASVIIDSVKQCRTKMWLVVAIYTGFA